MEAAAEAEGQRGSDEAANAVDLSSASITSTMPLPRREPLGQEDLVSPPTAHRRRPTPMADFRNSVGALLRDRRRRTRPNRPPPEEPVTGAARENLATCSHHCDQRERMRVSGRTWNDLSLVRIRPVSKTGGEGRFGGLWRHVARRAALPEDQVRDAKGMQLRPTSKPSSRPARRCAAWPARSEHEHAMRADPKAVTLSDRMPASSAHACGVLCAGTIFQDACERRRWRHSAADAHPHMRRAAASSTPPNCSCPATSSSTAAAACRSCARRARPGLPDLCGPTQVLGARTSRSRAPTAADLRGGIVPVGTPPRCRCPRRHAL